MIKQLPASVKQQLLQAPIRESAAAADGGDVDVSMHHDDSNILKLIMDDDMIGAAEQAGDDEGSVITGHSTLDEHAAAASLALEMISN